MIQAYQGYFEEDGRFIANNTVVKIPVKRRVIINILDDEVNDAKVDSEKEIEERKAIFESLKGCLRGQEVDLKEIREERLKKRGLL